MDEFNEGFEIDFSPSIINVFSGAFLLLSVFFFGVVMIKFGWVGSKGVTHGVKHEST